MHDEHHVQSFFGIDGVIRGSSVLYVDCIHYWYFLWLFISKGAVASIVVKDIVRTLLLQINCHYGLNRSVSIVFYYCFVNLYNLQ